jgi:PAS domain S-box-containing protein
MSQSQLRQDLIPVDDGTCRQLIEQLPFLVFIGPPSGRVEQCNQWFVQYTGLSPEALATSSWNELVYPDDWREGSTAWQEASTYEQVYEAEMRLRRHDGEYRWHLLRVVPPQGGNSLWVGTALDIHDRRSWEQDRESLLRELGSVMERRWTVEEKLRQSEERFRAAFEQAAVGIVLAQVQTSGEAAAGGSVDLANPGFRAMLDYGAENLSHLTFHDLTHPDDRDVDKEDYARLLRGAVPFYTVEKRLLRRDGEPVWCQVSTSPLRGPGGTVLATLSFVTNISERRRSEEARQRAEVEAEANRRLSQQIASAMPGILYLLDLKEGRSLYASGATKHLLGYEPEQLLAFTNFILDLCHPDDRTALSEDLAKFMNMADGEPLESEFRIRHADGSYHWLRSRDVVFSRDRRGRPRTVIGVAVDVTVRREVEQSLMQSEERLRIALDAARMGTWDWDVAGGSIVWNDWHYRLFGMEPQSEPRTREDFRRAIHPDDWERVSETIQSAAHSRPGEPNNFLVLFRVIWPNGEIHWMECKGQVTVRDDADMPARMSGTIVDVTARQDAEEALRRSHEELEGRVAARTAELRAANANLEREVSERRDAQAARGQLLRRLVSVQEDERKRISRELHDEFGQSLTALMLGLKSLPASEGSETKLSQLQKLTAQVMEQMHHLARELRPAALDTLGLEATMRQLAEEWSERNEVKTEFFARGLHSVRLPAPIETTIYRVAQEALTNVARHAKGTFVSVLVERHDGVVSLIVEDNGHGFDAESPDIGEGRLGLLGMRERIELVGGTLDIESSPGAGTTVIARVPLENNPATKGEQN